MTLETILTQAITLNLSRRNSNIENQLGDIHYLREFCTIRLSLGRMTGNTTFINKHLHGENAVVVTTLREGDMFDHGSFVIPLSTITRFRGSKKQKVNWLFVDNASHLMGLVDETEFYREIYRQFDPNLVIMLG